MKPDYAIDIDQVLASKGVSLPGWVKRLIKRLLRLDELNEYFVQGREGVDFCKGAMEFLDVDVEVHGLEDIPADGLYTFASNHPLGGIDGVALCASVGEKFGGKVRCPVNDFLMLMKGYAPIGVPVSKTGSQSRELPGLLDGMFGSDNQVVIFPAGLCSRLIDGRIQDLPWSKTFILKSVKNGRSIVPVHFEARNSRRFYIIAKICSFLRLKFNFAMAFLPDEMLRQRGGRFIVKFGRPIPPSTFDSSRKPSEWAAWVRDEVYKI